MPLPVLIALFLAFGFDAPGETPAGPFTRAEAWRVAAEVVGMILALGTFAVLFGRLVAWLTVRHGGASYRLRRAYSLGGRLVQLLSLVLYGRMIYDLGWADLIRQILGTTVFLDEVLIFLPFIVMQLLGWWGFHCGDRALRRTMLKRPGRYVVLKARQAYGMVLPVAAVYAIGSDVVQRVWPGAFSSPWDKPLILIVMGSLVLALSPLLVRIAWPTSPLPPCPLRDRLELLAKRVGFRCTDILVWDTGGSVINAGVTGSLPFFRYVLLTDALIESLSPPEIAAVFGHEIGHIAHRHLVTFGLFIFGSFGIYALTDLGVTTLMLNIPRPPWLGIETTASFVFELSIALLAVGGYFLVVFGHLSRRFERQADVYGCRVVSCGMTECPRFEDVYDDPHGLGGSTEVCPTGIRIFISALSNVALLNGMKPAAWSWRHGSIAARIDFLESLTNQPEAERKFQRGIKRMLKGLTVLLFASLLAAIWGGLFR